MIGSLLLACGGSGRGDDESATGTGPGSTSGAPTSSSSGSTGEPTGGSGTAGASEATTTTTSAATGSSSGTTSDPKACVDTPPAGFMGPSDPTCEVEPMVGMFNPVVEWTKSAWTVNPGSISSYTPPIVASLSDDNGDGVIDTDDTPDILYVTLDNGQYAPGTLRVMSGDGLKEILSVAGSPLCGSSSLAVGDLDGDKKVEIVGITADLRVIAFEHDGAQKWMTDPFPLDMSFCYTAPAIGDMDGDGSPEVVAGRVILRADGTLRGKGAHGTGAGLFSSTAFPLDVTGDGVQEVVAANALYTAEGADLWFNGLADGYPAVADFDKDGVPEIVVAATGTVRLMDNAGGVVWNINNPAQGGGPPTIADFDGDGLPEIGVAGLTAYTVFDTDGKVLWSNPTQDMSSAATGSSVYDFEGDGVAEVVYADEINLYIWSGTDGSLRLLYEPHSSGTIIEYPIIADVDGDGQVEIAVVDAIGLTVLGDADKSWRPGRKVWNQHAYNITNVADDGAIPTMPQPNWAQYNNFRSGDLSPPDGSATPDLTLEVSPCQASCTSDYLKLWVQLGNEGASPLTAGAVIEVYGVMGGVEMLAVSQPYADVIDPGQYAEGVAVELDPSAFEKLIIRAKANEAECKEDNNEQVLEPPFCQIPG